MGNVLEPGARISHYRVVGPLGAGGMGEVYLAQDLDLDRPVALKILPPRLVANQERLRRFILEAKSASSLNHPNIVTIHEIGQGEVQPGEPQGDAAAPSESVQFIAMEFVNGKTLGDAIHVGNEDLRTLLGYLAQAAEGLAKAHAAGIVHRDLKPGNIMVSNDGFAKVLDFGLAKLVERSAVPDEGTNAPTEAQERTGEGVVLGTVGYMSPEQVQGRPVDHRSDIFSFGCILYEAATRQRPFAGDSSVATMHKILSEKPQPVEELNQAAPAELRRLIRRCLAKSPDQRLHAMKDLAIELREIVDEYETLSASATSGSDASSVAALPPARLGPAVRTGIVVLALVALAGLGLGIYALVGRAGAPGGTSPPPAPKMTVIPARGHIFGAALSPDGRYLARVSGPPGRKSLWMRQLATGTEIEILPPSDPAPTGLTFSPDGSYVYYLAQDPETSGYKALYQIASLGGTPRRRTFDVDSAISFAPDGRRVTFARGVPGTQETLLIILDLESGEARTIASVKWPGDINAGPVWSPDGRRIAASIWRPNQALSSQLVAFNPDDGTQTPLRSGDWGRVNGLAWRPGGDGLVMTARTKDITATAQIWDVSFPGAQVRPITNDLNEYLGTMVSGDGRTVGAVRQARVMNLWIVGADGVGRPRAITFRSSSENSVMDYKPSGNDAVMFQARDGSYMRLWAISDDGGDPRPITSGPFNAFSSRWLPDGSTVFAQVGEDRHRHVWRLDPTGGDPRRLTDGSGEAPLAVSPDGRTVLFRRLEAPRKLWEVATSGGEARRLLQDCDGDAIFSPDGTRIAYESTRDVQGLGRSHQVIVPTSGGEPQAVLMLPASGFDVAWAPDGRALTYVTEEKGVHNVLRQPIAGGPAEAITLFAEGRIQIHRWSPDGRRLLIIRWLDDADNLWISGADGGDPVKITEFATGHMDRAEWTPDGRRVIFAYGDLSSDIVLMSETR